MTDDEQPSRGGVNEVCRFCSPPRAKSPIVESCTPLVLQFEVEEAQDALGLQDLLQPLLDPRGSCAGSLLQVTYSNSTNAQSVVLFKTVQSKSSYWAWAATKQRIRYYTSQGP